MDSLEGYLHYIAKKSEKERGEFLILGIMTSNSKDIEDIIYCGTFSGDPRRIYKMLGDKVKVQYSGRLEKSILNKNRTVEFENGFTNCEISEVKSVNTTRLKQIINKYFR